MAGADGFYPADRDVLLLARPMDVQALHEIGGPQGMWRHTHLDYVNASASASVSEGSVLQ